MKPPTSVIGPGAPIRIPEFAHNVEFEGSLLCYLQALQEREAR